MAAIHRRLYQAHAWLGLITGLFLLLLGLSGSALVFMREQDRWLERERLTITPTTARPLPLDSLYSQISRRYPNLDGLVWLNPDRPLTEARNIRLYLNDARLATYDLGLLSMNPYTGEILREGRSDTFRTGLMAWLFQFHFSFHLGIPGAALTALFGLTMLLSLLTGVIVYRKFIWKVLTFRVRIGGKNWRTRSSSLHRVVGVWSLLLNAIIFFTGFWMNLFAFDAKVWQGEQQPTPPTIRPALSIDQLYAKARQALPSLQPKYVYWPTQLGRAFRVSGRESDGPDFLDASVALDAQTGAVNEVSTFRKASVGAKLEALVYPLHVGTIGGWPVQLLYVMLGLTPGLLAITGFLLWWRRTRPHCFRYTNSSFT